VLAVVKGMLVELLLVKLMLPIPEPDLFTEKGVGLVLEVLFVNELVLVEL